MQYAPYLLTGIYLLTLASTLLNGRRHKQHRPIAGGWPLVISVAMIATGISIAKSAHYVIGPAFLLLSLFLAMPLFAFGLARVVATLLLRITNFKVVFVTALVLCVLMPFAAMKHLNDRRAERLRVKNEKISHFQTTTIKGVMEAHDIKLPASPNITIAYRCKLYEDDIEGNCVAGFSGESVLKIPFWNPYHPDIRFQYVEISPPRTLKLQEMWCARRSDQIALDWCQALPTTRLKFELRDDWPKVPWDASRKEEIPLPDEEYKTGQKQPTLKCNIKGRTFCESVYKISENLRVTVIFQQVDKSEVPYLAAESMKETRRLWFLMTESQLP